MRQSQTLVRTFLEENNLCCSAEVRLLDVMSELGEVGKEILRSTQYGKVRNTVTEDLKEELGDLFFSLLAFSIEIDIDAEDALNKAIEKYGRRSESSGSIGSGTR